MSSSSPDNFRLHLVIFFQIINIRNHTMHSPDFMLDETYATDSLRIMVSFLEAVHNAMKGVCDIDDCESAIALIKEVSYCQFYLSFCAW